ncbi:hypothetical protein [Bifidobacterium choerinum]|uniref:Uncharacterized protein n=1 Tax=Bifidobacterium choerinum TaxID=35760 RepID=A0A2D3D835_9BIFI|nr:hypothetical protein [Bifidobacterium choerinum]ATU21319.1 hypothetical protein BcFMB_09255 [Bifidobacterium choerinum]
MSSEAKERQIIVQQIRKYTKLRGMKNTSSGKMRTSTSLQQKLEDLFGAAAPNAQTLQRLVSATRSQTPTPIQLLELSIALNVPLLALILDVDQPYKYCALYNEKDGSGLKLTNLDLFNHEAGMFLNTFTNGTPGKEESLEFMLSLLPIELQTMKTAYSLHVYKTRLSPNLNNITRDEFKNKQVLRERAVENLTGVVANDEDLMRTSGLYYPEEEHEEAYRLVQRAIEQWQPSLDDAPYLPEYERLCNEYKDHHENTAEASKHQ